MEDVDPSSIRPEVEEMKITKTVTLGCPGLSGRCLGVLRQTMGDVVLADILLGGPGGNRTLNLQLAKLLLSR